MNKEKQYCDGKEIIRACAWCSKEGVQTYMDETNQRITDMLDLWEIEDKLEQDIAVLSHGICSSCLDALPQTMCHDDNLTLLK
jgi:hypothetical protein